MFSIIEKKDVDFEKVILMDDESNTFIEVIPSCGGLLHAFSVLHEGYRINVIDQYAGKKDFLDNVTAKGFKSCKLSPFACRINNARYIFNGKEYILHKFLLDKNALHGLLYDAPFSVIHQEADENRAKITLQCDYRHNDPGYPFDYDAIVTYQFERHNALSISTTVFNRHSGSIPIQDGWHPYFTFGKPINDLQLEFQSMEMLEFNESLIPTGNLIPYSTFNRLKNIDDSTFDNCFTLNFNTCQPLCVLRDVERKLQVEIRPEKSYPYLQLYTPGDRKSIAIENLSAAPDAFNNGMGLVLLDPGASVTFKTTYLVTVLT